MVQQTEEEGALHTCLVGPCVRFEDELVGMIVLNAELKSMNNILTMWAIGFQVSVSEGGLSGGQSR